MKRREFIAASAALLVSPRRSLAQGARRRVGFLAIDERCRLFRKRGLTGCETTAGLMEKTWSSSIVMPQLQDRLPAFAAELVALSPDLLIAIGPPAALALKSATANIPIVFVAWPIPWGSASSKAYRVQAAT